MRAALRLLKNIVANYLKISKQILFLLIIKTITQIQKGTNPLSLFYLFYQQKPIF